MPRPTTVELIDPYTGQSTTHETLGFHNAQRDAVAHGWKMVGAKPCLIGREFFGFRLVMHREPDDSLYWVSIQDCDNWDVATIARLTPPEARA